MNIRESQTLDRISGLMLEMVAAQQEMLGLLRKILDKLPTVPPPSVIKVGGSGAGLSPAAAQALDSVIKQSQPTPQPTPSLPPSAIKGEEKPKVEPEPTHTPMKPATRRNK